MLSKLMKYEFKATARYFLPIYIVILIMTPITKLITSIDVFDGYLSIVRGLFISIYALSLFALVVISIVVIILRFYKNLVSEEGYLMHTLPVTPSQHIISKTLVSFVWVLASMCVIILSLLFFVVPERIDFVKEAWNLIVVPAYNELGDYGILFVFLNGILVVIGLISSILYAYVSIAIGQVISKHRIIGAIAAAFVINILTQIFSAILYLSSIFIFDANVNDPALLVHLLYPINILLTIITTIGYYLITNYVLKKKLNLE